MKITEPTTPLIFHAQPGGIFYLWSVYRNYLIDVLIMNDFEMEINPLFYLALTVHVLNMGLMDNSPIGRLIRNVMLAYAEFERDMIVESTQEGKTIAKQRDDFREGRPKKFSNAQINHALSLLNEYSYRQVEQMAGISKSTLTRNNRQRK